LRKLLCGAAHINAAVGLGRERRLFFLAFRFAGRSTRDRRGIC
jgi:hypothetical protein